MNIKQTISRNLINIPGWRTRRKIVVIESDDWGSIRMSSKDSYNRLLKASIPVENDIYNKYDSLASEEDLCALFNVLRKHKDKNGNHPVITANAVVANPDFDKIRKSSFREYHYELFPETLKRYPEHQNSFKLWQEGLEEGLFRPQFHGREHLNVRYWMDALKSGNKELLLAFDEGVFGIPVSINNNNRNNLMAAFDISNSNHQNEVDQIVSEGLHLFKGLFGYNSKTMIAPCYIWSDEIEKEAASHGILGFQGIPYQYKPVLNGIIKSQIHYLGQKNAIGQHYLVRNSFFEPSYSKNCVVDETLARINTAFRWGKPAIIGSHRINFIGSLVKENRDKNLISFELLLKKILIKWPDVEFMSSDQVADLIIKKEN
jgi:hypothetical protein